MSSQLPPIVPVLLKINYKVELENPEAAILQEWLDRKLPEDTAYDPAAV